MSELVLQRPKIKSKAMRELNVMATITARGITLFLKSPDVIIMSLVMPVLVIGILDDSLAQNMVAGLGLNYGKFTLVDMFANILFVSTTSDVSSLVKDHFTDFTQEMMVSPASRYSVVIRGIISSSFEAVVSLIGTLMMGFVMGITLSVSRILAILTLSPLIYLSAGVLVMIVIGLIKSNKTTNLTVMLAAMPQMFLSGTITSTSSSNGVLLVINRLMPVTYRLDPVCAVVYAETPKYDSMVLFNPVIALVAIIAITMICLMIGTLFSAKNEKNR